MTSYDMEYPFGTLESAVLTVSFPELLPSPQPTHKVRDFEKSPCLCFWQCDQSYWCYSQEMLT